jgi:competence protein ComEC
MSLTGRISGWLGLAIIVCCIGVSWGFLVLAVDDHTQNLSVSFLDVGQGDATLIETPNGREVLIDGGKRGSLANPLADSMPFYDRSIDLVIATHTDTDHIGGLPGLLRTYNADQIAVPSRFSQTSAAQNFRRSVQVLQGNGAVVDTLTTGDVLRLSPQTYLLALFPSQSAVPKDPNKGSMVLKLIHGETSMLLTGDAPASIENYLVDRYGKMLSADILKVGHHGSETSSSWPFVSVVSPDHAVISAGADNPYGHPHQAVVERFRAINASTTCTCQAGTIEFVSDGKKFGRAK